MGTIPTSTLFWLHTCRPGSRASQPLSKGESRSSPYYCITCLKLQSIFLAWQRSGRGSSDGKNQDIETTTAWFLSRGAAAAGSCFAKSSRPSMDQENFLQPCSSKHLNFYVLDFCCCHAATAPRLKRSYDIYNHTLNVIISPGSYQLLGGLILLETFNLFQQS